jgi:hypothetical protein
MENTRFDLANIDMELSNEARDVILALVMSWGLMETTIGLFFLRAFRLAADDGSILVGPMDTKAKLDKLKTLYQHHGMASAAKSIADLKAAMAHFVEVRNLIAHGMCIGHHRLERGDIVFTVGKFAKGKKGKLLARVIPLAHIENATQFADSVGDVFSKKMTKLKAPRSARPPAPPAFEMRPPPTPHKNGGERQGRRPRPSPESP